MNFIQAILLFLGTSSAMANTKTKQINPSHSSAFDILDIRLTKDTFSQIEKTKKNIKIIKAAPKETNEGEGEYHYDSFCFVGADGTKVTFTSNYSYSGSEIAEYVIERKAKGSGKVCTLLKKLDAKIKIPVGLGLGMTKKNVETMFGKSRENDLTINSEGAETKTKLLMYHFEDSSLAKQSPDAPPPPSNIGGGTKTKSKPKFYYSLDLGLNFDSLNTVDTIYVSFSAEPGEI